MKIAVLGSGNGGCAIAFDYAAHGHDVYLFDFEQFPEKINVIQKNGGIYAEGELEGFSSIKYAGHDLKIQLESNNIIPLPETAGKSQRESRLESVFLTHGHADHTVRLHLPHSKE